MDMKHNPFVPGAGTTPPALVGRDAILQSALTALHRIKNGRPEKSMFLIGLRGVGKTVLLREIERQAQTAEYRIAFIEAVEERQKKSLAALLAPELRKILLGLERNPLVRHAMAAFASFIGKWRVEIDIAGAGVGVEAVPGLADSGDLEADLSDLFGHLGHAARDCETAIAIMVDELQYVDEKELSALIMAMHKSVQHNLPLLLVGAGLPQLVGKAGNAKSYAERLFAYPEIGALDRDSAIEALTRPVTEAGVRFAPKALDDIIAQTHGYPYFLQEWGYQAWNIAAGDTITHADARQATETAIARLDRDFFRVRLDRLTPREKEYAFAMAELGAGAHKSGEIAERLGKDVQQVAPFRSSLIKKGMVYAPAHGDTAFTVPLFDEFLHRQRPSWP